MNYVSIDTLFAKIKADLDLDVVNINISDWIEWSAEALKRIDAYPMPVPRITGVRDAYGVEDILSVSNFQAELPCDFYKEIMVAFSSSETGAYMVARKNTNVFDMRSSTIPTSLSSTDGTIITYNPTDYDKYKFIQYVFNENYAAAVSRLNSNSNLNTLLDNLFPTSGSNGWDLLNQRGLQAIYNIVEPYIRFDVRNGFAILAYLAIPTDENGYPLIPDDSTVMEAIKWFIEKNLMYKEMRRRKEGAAQLYQHAESKWIQFRNAAYGNIMMPKGVEELAVIQNSWLRIIPKIHNRWYGFRSMGTEPIL